MEVRWRPFFLNPQAPREGIVKRDYYVNKFGAERARSIEPMMTQRFAEVGEAFSMGGKTGATIDSHRLAMHAMKQGGADLQNRLMEELFLNYFTQEKYLGDREVLLAASAKLNLADAEQVVDDPTMYQQEVQQELAAFARNVRGVPHFIISPPEGAQIQLSGAQPTETFEEILTEIADQA